MKWTETKGRYNQRQLMAFEPPDQSGLRFTIALPSNGYVRFEVELPRIARREDAQTMAQDFVEFLRGRGYFGDSAGFDAAKGER